MELEGKLGKSGGKQRGRKVEIRGSEMVGRRRKGRWEERRGFGLGNKNERYLRKGMFSKIRVFYDRHVGKR